MKEKKYCSNCDNKYTIVYNEDDTDMQPLSCPFCSYEVDEHEEVEEEIINNETDEDDNWN
tara:strand:+ start:749 stop:928 length:180 start_codon:yes stop_codon:yes gene_type:complete